MSESSKGKRELAPPPPRDAAGPVSTERRVGHIDGRSARATGRVVQFNTRVRVDWLEDFERLLAAEQVRMGERITRGYFLEVLTAVYRQHTGESLPVFGLPQKILAGLDKIMEHTGLEQVEAMQQAIAVYLKTHGVVKTKSKGDRQETS